MAEFIELVPRDSDAVYLTPSEELAKKAASWILPTVGFNADPGWQMTRFTWRGNSASLTNTVICKSPHIGDERKYVGCASSAQ